jgi:hypothetical protein
VCLFFEAGFSSADDLRGASLEDLGKFEHCAESRALDATFEQADVGSVETAFEREFFLRKTALGTHFSKSLSKRPLGAGSGMNVAAALLCQQPYAAMLTTIVPRIIVRISSLSERARCLVRRGWRFQPRFVARGVDDSREFG